MKGEFKHSGIFPLIFRAITDLTCKDSDFLNHDLLVAAILQNDESRGQIEEIAHQNSREIKWTAANLVAWFSQRYTKGENVYSDLLERTKINGTWAYRSLMSSKTSLGTVDAELIDPDLVVIEGAPKLVQHLKRERNAKVIKAKLEDFLLKNGVLKCECCAFEPNKVFPGIDSILLEVHHRNPLGSSDTATTTSINDLAVLCPTCHRAIHRLDNMSVDEMRVKYFSQSK